MGNWFPKYSHKSFEMFDDNWFLLQYDFYYNVVICLKNDLLPITN